MLPMQKQGNRDAPSSCCRCRKVSPGSATERGWCCRCRNKAAEMLFLVSVDAETCAMQQKKRENKKKTSVGKGRGGEARVLSWL